MMMATMTAANVAEISPVLSGAACTGCCVDVGAVVGAGPTETAVDAPELLYELSPAKEAMIW
jgi:hypothetical protein